jgi:arylsulfatase A
MKISEMLDKKILTGALLPLAGTMGFLSTAGCRVADERPNIIIILADDMGYGDPGCYNAESKIPTPNIDSMAGNGLRFTDAHSPSAVSSPTRYGILTGRYAWRSPLKHSVLWAWDSSLIESDRVTIESLLQKEGYYTACIGKWHLGWDWPTTDGSRVNDSIPIGTKGGAPYRIRFADRVILNGRIPGGPVDRGFNYYFGDDVPNFPPYTFFENDHLVALPDTVTAPGEFGTPGPKLKGWRREAVMPALTAHAVELIRAGADNKRFGKKKGQPFFLYFPLTAPHTPIAPDSAFLGTSQAGRYGDYVHEVDWTVGEVMKALRETGQLQNTLVIFTSDNGSPERNGVNYAGPVGSIRAYGHFPNYIWRGTKSEIWEGGTRVPFIVQWPGHVAAGDTCNQTACHIDLMATIADLLGIDLPDGAGPDSYSMLPVWLNPKETFDRPEPIILHSINGMFAIREGQWKFIDGKGSGGWSGDPHPDAWAGQMYNLAADSMEGANLYGREGERIEGMKEDLDRVRGREDQ